MKKLFTFLLITFLGALSLKAQNTDSVRLENAYAFLDKDYAKYDPKQAFDQLAQLAGSGNAEAMNALGILYSKGLGTEPNIPQAVHWLNAAAQKGYSQAWYNLGTLYKEGVGIPQDFTAAFQTFEKGVSVNQPQCLYAKGYMHYKGLGCTQDYQAAAVLFRRAIEWGSTASSYMLGLCYRNGYGVAVNLDSARYFLTKAAKSGNVAARNEMVARLPENLETVPGQTAPSAASASAAIQIKNTAGPKDGIAGQYSGFITKYDWSRKHVIGVSSLSLNLMRKDSLITGEWVENDTIATYIQGILRGETIVFKNTAYQRTNHYSPDKGQEMEFKNASLNLARSIDTVKLSGSLQQWAAERHEPGKPMFISMIRTEAAPQQNSLSETAALPLLAKKDGFSVYPNPFRSAAKVSFTLPQKELVQLSLIDMNGKVLYKQENRLEAGAQEVSFSAAVLPAGAYVLRLSYGSEVKTALVIKE